MNLQSENSLSAVPPVRRRSRRAWWAFTVTPITLALGFFAALFANYGQAQTDAKGSVRATLTDAARTQATALRARIDAQYTILDSAAAALSLENPLRLSKTSPWLAAVRKAAGFSFLAAIDLSGMCYFEDGTIGSVADRDYFQKSASGHRGIEKIRQTRNGGGDRFILSVPIVQNDTVAGVLACSYEEDRFRSLLVSEAFDQQGYSFVCDGQGNALILGFRSGEALPATDVSALCTDLPAERGLLLPRTVGDRTYYAVYEPLGVGGWTLAFAVPDSVVLNLIRERTGETLTAILIAMAASLLAFGALLVQEWCNRRVLQAEHERLRVQEEEYRIATEQGNQFVYRLNLATKTASFSPPAAREIGSLDQLSQAPDAFLDGDFVAPESKEAVSAFFAALLSGQPKAEGDFRLKNSRGQYRWYHNEGTLIYSDGGKPLRAVISFRDVTRQREMNAAYESWRKSVNALPPERYALFTYDLTHDRRADAAGTLFPDDPTEADMLFDRYAAGFINRVFPEDRGTVARLLDRENVLSVYRQGTRFIELEFRYAPPGSHPRWLALSLRLVEREDTGDVTAFLLYEDIDARKREELALKAKGEKDPLTGVLNRSALMERVETALAAEPDVCHAVMMIDLDNFKRINDTNGHAAGDRVLTEIAGGLASILRPGDCVGRIGGDEFLLFMRNIPSGDVVLRRAELALEKLCRTFDTGLAVSGSLGVALYPENGRDFKELYAAADAAMYYAKARGKRNFAFYNRDIAQKTALGAKTPIDPGAGQPGEWKAPAGPRAERGAE